MTDNHVQFLPDSIGIDLRQAELIELVSRFAPGDGLHQTAIAPLQLIRASAPAQRLPSVYEPGLCVVVQGRKQATLAGEVFTYDPLHFLLISVTLPTIGQILEATPDKPYLCVRLQIDAREVGALVLESGAGDAQAGPQERGLRVSRVSAPLLDAVLRLLRLLCTPQDAPVLAPLALREIYYRVLTGEMGARLRQLALADSHTHRIARAIELLQRRYAEAVRIEEVAEAAHMSPSSLHHHFKQVTAMSPLQFQKQLRLHRARQLMLTEGVDAAVAGHRVGYESPSQFSREYRRLFGAPPRAETEHLRHAR
ncbi:MAG TPA: AraC family transcriptional regulator [Albitalea sp.]|nr:AraC family transcriptional regulator [Albitalea sp.]